MEEMGDYTPENLASVLGMTMKHTLFESISMHIIPWDNSWISLQCHP